MTWPTATDYHEAVQNLGVSVGDEELRAGQLATNSLGLPMLWSGNFADVYKIYCPATNNTWALKCFTREVSGLRERYREIAAHLDRAQLPFTVDFQYLEQGIRAGSRWFPALKMRWVEGLTLDRFVEEHVNRPRMLKQLLGLWVKMADRLRDAEVAHTDLQHGNVLLVPMSGGRLALQLIDYDGMHVPALAGTRSGELGHPAFQHPQRLQKGIYNAEVDRFSHLAIFCAIRCLTVGRKKLWEQFNNEDNLLFRESDFRDPGTSEAFHTLWRLPNAKCRALVGHLALACRKPLEEVPLLTELTSNGNIFALSRQEESEVDSLLTTRRQVAHSEQERSVPEEEQYGGSEWWFGRPSLSQNEQSPSAQAQVPPRQAERTAEETVDDEALLELEWSKTFHNILAGIAFLAFLGLLATIVVREFIPFAATLFATFYLWWIVFSLWWIVSLVNSPMGQVMKGHKRIFKTMRRELHQQEEKKTLHAKGYQAQEMAMRERIGRLEREHTSLDSTSKADEMQLRDRAREMQRYEFLANHRIQDASIPGIGEDRASTLASYQIETAREVNDLDVFAVPGFGVSLTRALVAWRGEIERSFRYDSEDPRLVADIQTLKRKMQERTKEIPVALERGRSKLQELSNARDKEIGDLDDTILEMGIEVALADDKVREYAEGLGLSGRVLRIFAG